MTTVHYMDANGLTLKPLGENHTEIILSLDNSDGAIPFMPQGKEGAFHLPLGHLWTKGLDILAILKTGVNP